MSENDREAPVTESAQATTIGFRVEPKAVNWAVVTGTAAEPKLIDAGTLPAPKGYSEQESLRWYRQKVVDLVQQYGPPSCGIRDSEAGPRPIKEVQDRCRIEGVVIEAAASKGCQVVSGRLKSISSSLASKGAKRYLDEEEFRELDWSRYHRNVREAILVATSLLGG